MQLPNQLKSLNSSSPCATRTAEQSCTSSRARDMLSSCGSSNSKRCLPLKGTNDRAKLLMFVRSDGGRLLLARCGQPVQLPCCSQLQPAGSNEPCTYATRIAHGPLGCDPEKVKSLQGPALTDAMKCLQKRNTSPVSV